MIRSDYGSPGQAGAVCCLVAIAAATLSLPLIHAEFHSSSRFRDCVLAMHGVDQTGERFVLTDVRCPADNVAILEESLQAVSLVVSSFMM
jgi:hypothetical protein